MASASEGRAGRLAIATCAELAELDPEGQLLLAELAQGGIDAEPAVWDDPTLDWAAYDRILLRSTWDYPSKQSAFESWIDERQAQLINPAALVRWNLSKRYLQRLSEWGFPVVPSSFTAPGERVALPEHGECVVKPAVSAGSVDTARYGPGDRARAAAHADSLLAAGREVMVQPYMASVDRDAETAVIVLGGLISHTMRKAPLLALGDGLEQGLFRVEQMEPREPTGEQAALAEAVVGRVAGEVARPTYARVDLLQSDSGEPLILELELIEPSLFLDHHPPAARRLVALLQNELER